ncbi:unnamed protein product [Brachionus calyciflorus]|uniref:Uncharacterized protein n=1 Tax=Brachionus calyciflorus TaxID=104777 RepID=A0A814DCC2_9BILA|nr:unnamed protein product [Brachionus calyciflorus]
MQTIKSEIIDYSSSVINEIDIQCEIVLEKLNEKNKIERMSQVNDTRKIMIEKVHEIEKFNLDDLSTDTKCSFEKKIFFFIPNNEFEIVPFNKSSIKTKMLFNNELGMLIVLSYFEDKGFIETFKNS